MQGKKNKKTLKFVQDLVTNYTRVESILYEVKGKEVRKIHFNTSKICVILFLNSFIVFFYVVLAIIKNKLKSNSKEISP